MKKVIGWILIVIPVLNFIGRIAASANNREIPISPATIIILIMMFGGGITLLNSASNKKDEEPPTKDIVKKDD